jgi:hypothetical protein
MTPLTFRPRHEPHEGFAINDDAGNAVPFWLTVILYIVRRSLLESFVVTGLGNQVALAETLHAILVLIA